MGTPQVNCGIHNRFDIEVRDAGTGELKQRAQAFNIVLNSIWARLVAGLAYSTNIHFGGGSGTLSPDRTTLFSWIGQKPVASVELIRAVPVSSVQKKIELAPEEFVGQTIREVGVGYSSSGSSLVTHAMLQDSQGNSISITKTALDVVTIYATIFATFATQPGVSLASLPSNNELINYLTAGYELTATRKPALGQSDGELHAYAPHVLSQIGETASACAWSQDLPNKRRYISPVRFGTVYANGHACEVGYPYMWRALLPLGGTGQTYQGVSVGTGDGTQREFLLPSKNVRPETIAAKVGGVSTPVSVLSRREQNFSDGIRAYYVYDEYRGSWTPDGALIAVVGASTLYLYGNSSVFIGPEWQRITLPANGRDVRFSPDGQYLAVSFFVSPWLKLYKRSGTVLTELPAPAALPSYCGEMAWSPDGQYLAVAADYYSTCLIVYKRQGDTFASLTLPSLPAAYCYSVTWSPDGTYLALGLSAAPWLKIYKRTGDTFAELTAPATMPQSVVRAVRWSPDGQCLAVGQTSIAPLVLLYRQSGDAFTAITGPTGVGGAVSALGWSPTEPRWLAVGTSSGDTTRFYCFQQAADGSMTRITSATDSINEKVLQLEWSTDGNRMLRGQKGTYSQNQLLLAIFDVKPRSSAIVFSTPPAAGTAITADYTVNGLHKTDQYVVDVSFAIQFGEVV